MAVPNLAYQDEVDSPHTPTDKKADEGDSMTGIIKCITPVKTSRKGNKYFNFTMVNGEEATPGVSFESDSHNQFQSMSLEQSPVRVTGITIKRPHNTTHAKREIIFTKRSKLMNYNADGTVVADLIPDHSDDFFTAIGKIDDLALDTIVNIKIKVIQIGNLQLVQKRDGSDLKLQKVIVADQSGSISITLWENNIDQLKHEQCYKMFNMTIQEFQNDKYLGLGSDSIVNICKDIGHVYPESVAQSSMSTQQQHGTMKVGEILHQSWKVDSATIIGCSNVAILRLCLFCHGNIGTTKTSNDLTVCKSCNACIRISSCSINFTCILMFQISTPTDDEVTASSPLQLIANYKDIKQIIPNTSADLIQQAIASYTKVMQISLFEWLIDEA